MNVIDEKTRHCLQIADTFVSIAAYKHKLGEGREEWQATMETALRYADEAGNKKLQVRNLA